MKSKQFFTRGFLTSLTGSLLLHLILLLILLVPSQNNASIQSKKSMLQSDTSSNFNPARLINYSNRVLQSALNTLSKNISLIPKERNAWNIKKFKHTYQSTANKMKINVLSVSILKSSLSERDYSIKTSVKSDGKTILKDCLELFSMTGIATKRSNFKSDLLLLTFSNDAGTVITVKVTTNDCRLFNVKKLSAKQILQHADIF